MATRFTLGRLTDLSSPLLLAAGFELTATAKPQAALADPVLAAPPIDGGAGNDSLTGTAGDDVLRGLSGADTLTGSAGNDILYGYSGPGGESPAGADGADELHGGTGSDLLFGNAGSDRLFGEANEDELQGDAGDDTLDGGEGVDGAVYRFDEIALAGGVSFNASSVAWGAATTLNDGRGGTDSLVGIEYVVVRGSAFNDTVTGSEGEDQLIGRGGNDSLNGNGSSDQLHGNEGNDSLNGGWGADALFGDVGDDQLRGDHGADALFGGDGNDYMTGGDGNDTIDGGNGDNDWADYFYTTQTTGIVANLATGIVTGGGGTDRLRDVENVNGTDFADRLIGNTGYNMIDGRGGNDTIESGDGDDRWLYGGSGNDSMTGGAGNQAFGGGAGNDTIRGGEGGDYMRGEGGNDVLDGGGNTTSSVIKDLVGYNDYAAPAAVRVDLQLGTAVMGADTDTLSRFQGAIGTDVFNDTLRGAAIDEYFAGRGGNDLIEGRGGDDYMEGQAGNDTINGGANDDEGDYAGYFNSTDAVTASLLTNKGGSAANGSDTYIGIENLGGGAFNDRLTGNDAANILIGESGHDTLVGGGGNDVLGGIGGNDVLDGGTGSDTAYYWTTATDTGFLFVLGPAGYATDGTQTDTLISIENINGSGGNDTVIGDGGANWLNGQGGNDWLEGAGGADTMIGGNGNDTYVVNGATDLVTESGTVASNADTVRSTMSWTLGANLERLTLTGSGAINGTGNALANLLIGNAANNVLNGGTGNDTLIGGLGNDTYVVNTTLDRIVEGGVADVDTVHSSVAWTLGAGLENLTLLGSSAINGTGNAASNMFTGNTGANTLNGGAGNDTLDGKAGLDVLIGGAGLDTFRFTTAPAAANADRLSDFLSADDRIVLDDAVFAGIGAVGALSADAFRAGAAAQDASDRVIYNAATGQLFYDADGTGASAAVLFATVALNTTIVQGDFFIV